MRVIVFLLYLLHVASCDYYFFGAEYDLNYSIHNLPDGTEVTPMLISSALNYTFNKFNTTASQTVTLEPINFIGNVSGLLIPENTTGQIQLMSNATVFTQNVILQEPIKITGFNPQPVKKVGTTFVVASVSVSRYVYNKLKMQNPGQSPAFIAWMIDIDYQGNSWATVGSPLTTDMTECTQSNAASRRLLSQRLFTRFYPPIDTAKDPFPECEPDGNEYCEGEVVFCLPSNAFRGGPYPLNIMLTLNESMPTTSIYTVIGRDDLINGNKIADSNSIVAYDENSINIKLKNTSLQTTQEEAVEYYYYEKGDLDVSVTNLSTNACVFIALSDGETTYVARCGTIKNEPVLDYNVLGWRFSNPDGTMVEMIPNGTYNVDLYLDADCSDTFIDEYKFDFVNPNYAKITYLTGITNSTTNDTYSFIASGVNLTSPNAKYNAGKSVELEVETAFGYGTQINFQFEICKASNCTPTNASRGTFDVLGEKIKIPVTLPGQLEVTSTSVTNKIVFDVLDCSNQTMNLTFAVNVTIDKEPESENKGLSPGAIVGIVCAAVLVCGLAAWWLCMKKSPGDGYRQLDE